MIGELLMFFTEDYCVDWNEWRQAYKALVVLEFLLTHGPLDFSQEFVCDSQVIHQLATFQFVDHNGINWGENMQRKSDEILRLLGGSTLLKEARLKALKIAPHRELPLMERDFSSKRILQGWLWDWGGNSGLVEVEILDCIVNL
ncbi:hypothetical protein F8388_004153 [Cannabis sativa]|uniref:ENTH domain-containing protein n=1 Tax=Cannabis sativa TaxID=3483 RepID=A0A7J6E703_CANSA|nr:hypothetical protein F8388_004153 [Cannabis sativa]